MKNNCGKLEWCVPEWLYELTDKQKFISNKGINELVYELVTEGMGH
jgi:hypothetical protein